MHCAAHAGSPAHEPRQLEHWGSPAQAFDSVQQLVVTHAAHDPRCRKTIRTHPRRRPRRKRRPWRRPSRRSPRRPVRRGSRRSRSPAGRLRRWRPGSPRPERPSTRGRKGGARRPSERRLLRESTRGRPGGRSLRHHGSRCGGRVGPRGGTRRGADLRRPPRGRHGARSRCRGRFALHRREGQGDTSIRRGGNRRVRRNRRRHGQLHARRRSSRCTLHDARSPRSGRQRPGSGSPPDDGSDQRRRGDRASDHRPARRPTSAVRDRLRRLRIDRGRRPAWNGRVVLAVQGTGQGRGRIERPRLHRREPREHRLHLAEVLRAIAPLSRQHARDERRRLGRQAGHDLIDGLGALGRMSFITTWPMPDPLPASPRRGTLVRDDADRPDVGAGVDVPLSPVVCSGTVAAGRARHREPSPSASRSPTRGPRVQEACRP